MKRRQVLIAKSYSDNEFFMKVSRKNEEVISRPQMIFYRSFAEIIATAIEKNSGHRYLLEIRDSNNSKLDTGIKLCCKRIAIFVKRKLEEYDNTLKIDIIKLY